MVALVAYLVVGHSYHPGETMDEAAVGAALCIVVVVLGAIVVVARPRALAVPPGTTLVAALPEQEPKAEPSAGARASPRWLQRFLN